MGHPRPWTTAITLMAVIAGCTFFPPPDAEPPSAILAGRAYLGAPLDNATVVVETAAGDPVETTPNQPTSQGRFFEEPSLSLELLDVSSHLPLIVKVSGGTVGGMPFDGTLLGYTSSFLPTDHLHVNILTTLIVKYKQAAGVTFRQAETAVATALHISPDIDLASKLHDPNHWFRLDPNRFMALAQANGGFDAFSDQLVTRMMGIGEVGVFLQPAGEGLTNIASEAGKWLIDSAGEGVVAWGVGEGLDWLLSAFGYQDPTEQALEQIQNQLTQVNEGLAQIQSQISSLSQQVQTAFDELEFSISNDNIANPEYIIQNQYQNMVMTYTPANSNLCTAAGHTMAANFAAGILNTMNPAESIDQQISDIYLNTTGNASAVYALTTVLIDKIQGGMDLYDAYVDLENFFGQLAGIQAQGLALMMAAINQPLDPTDGSGTTTAQWTATEYNNKFMSQMNEEVDVFLECVDRLVVTSVDVRSEIVQPIAYLSPETAEIYNRADFVASQLSNTQPDGLNVRLIGDPIAVSDWIANNKIQVAGQNPAVVSVHNNTINSYAATIPAGVSYYLEWTANASTNAFTFQKETQISIVKLNFPATAAGSFTVTTPTQTQTLGVALYNNSFQAAGATDSPITAYGSGVFYVRVLPNWQKLWTGFPGFENSYNDFLGNWTPSPEIVQMSLLTYPGEIPILRSIYATYEGQLASTIVNGTTGNVPVNLTWNGGITTTTNWSGSPKTSSNQSVICGSITQTLTTSGQGQPLSVTLTPNTSTPITYQASQSFLSSFDEAEYGENLKTKAWLNSLEIVPQQ